MVIGEIAEKMNRKCALNAIQGKWHNEFPKENWKDYGVEKSLELESRNNGSMINATEYLKSIGEIE